ncbi:P-loop containing nucleoside triphosphate hydrolase protein [Xylogone sp. PMI_703]|nr:P-loop containing nucleoside triphosphate hydrolase protein [Xylogone sp. PMI_703]
MTRKLNFGDLENADRIQVLGIIDKFRELGVNEDVSLPQLVVVGDQSSGKSSLLEGLTGLSFPVASDLCTRHATQIVLHRTLQEEASVKISIIPGPTANCDETQKANLEAFSKTLGGSNFDAEVFQSILSDAAVKMGLPGPDDDIENIEKRFSDDILKIELSGPEHYHLSVVDVPGLFHNPTKYQTEADKGIIRGLIEGYIVDPRTIILAVLDARNNLANQEVFRMAKAADPVGARTVGIITKCDALQEGDEPGVLKIAQNSVENLKHGWFAVKNRSTKEIQEGVTLEQRHINEKRFFETSPWNLLPRERVGIVAVKKFLGKLLYDHICYEFPALIKEIRGHIDKCYTDLEALGPPRRDSMEQRQFLMQLVSRYQKNVTDCLDGIYDSSLESQHPLKLRTHIQAANEAFGHSIEREGHTRPFRSIDGSVDEAYKKGVSEEGQNIYDWIRERHRESRGTELPGTLNPRILERLFREQSLNWEGIAFGHTSKVEAIISSFNQALFEKLIPEESLRHKIEARNSNFFNSTRVAAEKQLRQILLDERGGILQTVNHYYAETLNKIREDRILDRLQKLELKDGGSVDLVAIKAATHLSNEDQAVYDIHDALKAYYKVAVKRFMDNVILQVVERVYLGMEGPLKMISPEYVGSLPETDLAGIAGENYATASARTEIMYRKDKMEKALSLAQSLQIF